MSAIAKYLQSYENYFWQYEDSVKVIAVPEGHTLGYTDHILNEIILYLAPYGLPRFGSLLLALAATNSQGSTTIEDILRIVNQNNSHSDEVEQGIKFAKLLTQLPIRYKKGNLRIELLRAIFNQSHNELGDRKSMQIVKELKSNPKLSSFTSILKRTTLTQQQLSKQISGDFKTLRVIGQELDSVEAIMVRLSQTPNIALDLEDLDLELDKQLEDYDLIDNLKENNETFHVGALVASLISSMNIPFHSSLPSEQPLGGVADITNKGNFDKLLMSEFAFDDNILMSRLANNESLYHHREVPPADNKYSRIIIIDTTLRNWGTIKSISFAIMLAITNHPKNKNPTRVFLVGKSYKEISFSTVDEIIDGLQNLASSLDPGIGMYKLFTTEEIKISEIVFIGSKDSLVAPEMQRFSSELGKRIDHWIHPNNNGHIDVYKNPKRGKRFIQEIRLPLEKLWVKPQTKRRQTIIHYDNDYPILFPNNKYKTKWFGKHYIYLVTKNKGLQRRRKNQHHEGYKMIANNFPPSDILKAVMTHNDLSVTVLVRNIKPEEADYLLVSYPSQKRTPVSKLRYSKYYKDFQVEGGIFKCSSHTKTLCIDLEGNSTEKPIEFKIKKETNDRQYFDSIYQNIKKIFISNEDFLNFGKQELKLSGPNLFLMHEGGKKAAKVEAIHHSLGVFKFPDGSSIIHNKNGMITLNSSISAIPKIYIPPVLNTALGVATESTFAGNDFYQMKHTIEILLKDHETNLLLVTKIVKNQLSGISLRQAKMMVDTGIIVSKDEPKMMNLIKELDGNGISYTLRKSGLKQELITPYDFYNRYISLFINQIVNYGTGTS